ncbi:Uma2 family endonuclease [Streptomyces gamaensis]|uniref:Uma2 family endonuclease n=1 Tax=Streptomyces gamaensis TaxID=1763542 RepID=A0ABW0YY27_9ACTN
MAVMVETPPPQSIDRSPEPRGGFDELCRILEQIDAGLPDGYRTEIIGGKVVVSPWSRGKYLPIMRSFTKQVGPHVPEGHAIDTSPCLFAFPVREKAYGPDIHVSDEVLVDVDNFKLPGEALSLVAELTSPSTAHTDHTEKLEVYGKAGVPVYVLVDMLQAQVTVFSDPSPDLGYRTLTHIKFGDRVRIPAPFDCELDTAGWEA